jgi:hypothetical protein
MTLLDHCRSRDYSPLRTSVNSLPNAYWMVSENHHATSCLFREPPPHARPNSCSRSRFRKILSMVSSGFGPGIHLLGLPREVGWGDNAHRPALEPMRVDHRGVVISTGYPSVARVWLPGELHHWRGTPASNQRRAVCTGASVGQDPLRYKEPTKTHAGHSKCRDPPDNVRERHHNQIRHRLIHGGSKP